MKYFDWDKEKNEWLIKNRGISFEACVCEIQEDRVLSLEDNKPPFSHQMKYVVAIAGYAYVIPCVIEGDKVFLKTAYPSRKETKKYLSTYNQYHD